MTESWVAVILALASALAQALGTVMRHHPAQFVREGAGGRLGVLTSSFWWLGMAVSGVGFGFQGVALGFGSLILVQTLTVLSLAFALPLGAWFTGRRVSEAELVWGTVLAACVVVLVTVGRPTGGDLHPPWQQWLLACAGGVAVVGALVWAASRRRGDRALLLGMAGGTAFAYVALLTKGVADRFSAGGVGELVTTGEVYGLLAAAVVALALQQLSFEAGAVHQAVPASSATTPVVALVLGVVVLDERFAVSGPVLTILVATVALMAVATVRLSRKEVGGSGPTQHRTTQSG